MTPTRYPFEQSQSPLYRSNDGRLRVEEPTRGEFTVYDTELEEVALYTLDRVACDTYIAGYDYHEGMTR